MSRIHCWLMSILKATAVVSLCAMSLITVVDATGRYFLNAPLAGTVELIELLMILVIFASIPIVTQTRTHVKVDVFNLFRSHRSQAFQARLVQLLSAGVSGLLAWATWLKAQSVLDYGDMTQMLSIPLTPFVFIMAVLLTMDALLHLVQVFQPIPRDSLVDQIQAELKDPS